MKKKMLLLAGALSILSASAVNYSAPIYYESDFVSEFKNGNALPEGYVFRGVEGKVSGYSQYFPKYSATNPFTFLAFGANVACFTPAGLVNSSNETLTGDQWMITPPVTIGNDDAMFCFDVAQTGASTTQKFKVFVSEGGTEKEDFVEIYNGSMSGSANNIAQVSRRVVLQNYGGKTVRFAINAVGNKTGIIGFHNIYVGQYYCDVVNAENLEYIPVSDNASNTDLSVNLRMSTPFEVKGFTAVLRTEAGFETTFVSTDKFNKSTLRDVQFVFPEAIDMQGRESQNYTITITPNDPKLGQTVIWGRLVQANKIYDCNALVEEFTSQTCGWCPRGIAYMEYYKDLYNTPDNVRVIPIMIHDTMQSQRPDPMKGPANYIDPFTDDLLNITGQLGYPLALLNRTSGGDPAEVDVRGTLNSKSYAKTKIDKVGPDATNPNYLRISCKNTLSFNTGSFPVNIAAVIIENDVHQTGKSYDQTNYFYQYQMSAVTQAYGAALEPYFEQFVSPAKSEIPASEMYYPDVARAISNYYGETIPGVWMADQARGYDVLVEIPSTILNIENCSAIAMLLSPTGEVIASDIMPYAQWLESLEEGVAGVIDTDFSVSGYRASEGLGIRLSDNSMVSVYSIDGSLLFNGNLSAGDNVVAMPHGRTVVIRAVANGNVSTSKVVL